ncbi:rCG63415 [Rattus norvegicus]|uniref:RCG63415 n=1 Tax=Rattus norvegicus TaxID=10116 RepID=A6IMG5_RAT|nr:rCG63415 [Rattus norvegicus]
MIIFAVLPFSCEEGDKAVLTSQASPKDQRTLCLVPGKL